MNAQVSGKRLEGTGLVPQGRFPNEEKINREITFAPSNKLGREIFQLCCSLENGRPILHK